MTGQLAELVGALARALVDDPESVDATELEEGGATIVELRVSRDDIGKVIGKAGRTAEAMRIVLSAAATKAGCRAHLDIVD